MYGDSRPKSAKTKKKKNTQQNKETLVKWYVEKEAETTDGDVCAFSFFDFRCLCCYKQNSRKVTVNNILSRFAYQLCNKCNSSSPLFSSSSSSSCFPFPPLTPPPSPLLIFFFTIILFLDTLKVSTSDVKLWILRTVALKHIFI